MRLSRSEFSAWRDGLRWRLADIRRHQPRLFASLIVLLTALFVASAVLGLAWSRGASPRDDASNGLLRTIAPPEDTAPTTRYVAYGGLAQPTPDDREAPLDAAAEPSLPADVLQPLSEVLTADLDESELIYGSDGSEGSMLPLDNGVVASSGPRFETSWEIILPSAGIHAAVVQVGLTPGGAMGAPDNPFVVGWFDRSAVPGQLGNALLGGHRDYQDREGNVGVGVCWELDETRVGDPLVMFDQSTSRYYFYDIVDIVTIRPDSEAAVKYLSQTRESVVTLITCTGDFDAETHSYAERIVVVALLQAVAQPDAHPDG